MVNVYSASRYDSVATALLLASFNHLAYALECPIDLFARDGQRRRYSNHTLVRFLAQPSPMLESFAAWPPWTAQFYSNPQALAPHFLHIVTAQRSQTIQEVSAQHGRTLHHSFIHQHAQRSSGNRARQRVTTECASMITGVENTQHALRSQDRGD